MLSPDRLRTPDADDHDETELWERLRSEANRRSSVPPGGESIEPPAARFDLRAIFDSELQEEYASDSDLPPPPDRTAPRFVQSPPYPPPRESYARGRPAYSEAAKLAKCEPPHALPHDDEQDDDDYEREEYEAEQFAVEQYDLKRFSQPPPLAQPIQQHGQQSVRASLPLAGGFGQQYASMPPAAYGRVTPSATAQPQAHAPAVRAVRRRRSSLWVKPLVALVGGLVIGASSYQFAFVPYRDAERAAELAAQEQRKAEVLAQQEREEAEAAARAEAEQRAANEAALQRADDAAAAAQQTIAPAAGRASAAELRSNASAQRERRREERHARRAARAAAKAKAAAASRKRGDVSRSEDPLFGL